MIQHLIVLVLVGTCLGVVTFQAFSTLKGKKSKLGSCCSKGCGVERTNPNSSLALSKTRISGAEPATKSERIVFLPVEMLGRRK